MKLYHTFQIAAAGLIAVSLVGLVPLGYFWLQDKAAVAHAAVAAPAQPVTQPKPSVNVVTGHPDHLDIPSLNMHLQIIDGAYDAKTGEWTLTLDKVQFAAAYSVQPNNELGDVFLYGHYRPEVFAYLHLIKPGAQVMITTDNGYVFTYTYQSTAPFNPADTSPLADQGSGKPRLTVQTCSGTFMQNRQMYYFSYDSYAKA